MGMLKSDLQTVLELEQEGERRLEEAESAARALVEDYREKAHEIRRECERLRAREREKRFARLEADLAGKVDRLEDHFAKQKDRLSRRAKENREAAIEKVLAWLSGEVE